MTAAWLKVKVVNGYQQRAPKHWARIAPEAAQALGWGILQLLLTMLFVMSKKPQAKSAPKLWSHIFIYDDHMKHYSRPFSEIEALYTGWLLYWTLPFINSDCPHSLWKLKPMDHDTQVEHSGPNVILTFQCSTSSSAGAVCAFPLALLCLPPHTR